MVTVEELMAAVEEAFTRNGQAFPPWPDPHRDCDVDDDDESSRVSDPSKWRIIGARADAWLAALAELGFVASMEHDPQDAWAAPPPTRVTRLVRVVPRAPGALPLLVARSPMEEIEDAAVTLGVGHPAHVSAMIPYCGCDACDDGSQYELDQLDSHVLGVVTGAYRRLRKGSREITVGSEDGWRASGGFGDGEVESVLARSDGWQEISDASWILGH